MVPVSLTLQIGFVPAPPFVVDAVQEVEVDMSTEMASMFRIRFGIAQTATGDWSLLNSDIFRPLVPVTIRIASGSLPVPLALISGYVTSQRASYSLAAGDSTLEFPIFLPTTALIISAFLTGSPKVESHFKNGYARRIATQAINLECRLDTPVGSVRSAKTWLESNTGAWPLHQ